MTLDPSSNEEKVRLFVRHLLDWHEENRRLFPWRVDPEPYKVLIAELLLQRTPANRVAKFLPTFIERFPTPKSILKTTVEELEQIFQPMGLRKRAQWLTKLVEELLERHDGKVPNREEELVSLPGIGRYTARAILSFAFGEDVAVVDVNVVRLLSRVFGFPEREKRPSEDEEIWQFASKLVPKGNGTRYNEAVLDFAALICKKTPLCPVCPSRGICDYYQKETVKEDPN